MSILDRFRRDDELYDADTLDQRLEAIDASVDGLDDALSYIRDDIRMATRDVRTINTLMRWCLVLEVLILMVLSGLIGAAMIATWG